MDNYRLSRDRAQAFFLKFDQKKIIMDWDLPHDEAWLYTEFLGKSYRICRSSGMVERSWNGEQAEHGETLSIFDLLCHVGEDKRYSGRYAPVNSLKSRPRAIGVETGFYTKTAVRFDADVERFCRACERLGAEAVDMGDVGYRFPVFQKLSVILKFYRGDEDFPASITLLWDENMLQFVYYETVFYIAGVLLQRISDEMDIGSSNK